MAMQCLLLNKGTSGCMQNAHKFTSILCSRKRGAVMFLPSTNAHGFASAMIVRAVMLLPSFNAHGFTSAMIVRAVMLLPSTYAHGFASAMIVRAVMLLPSTNAHGFTSAMIIRAVMLLPSTNAQGFSVIQRSEHQAELVSLPLKCSLYGLWWPSLRQ